MEYWESGLVLNLLLLTGLLMLGALLRSAPLIRELGIPGSILGGMAGLVLGPSLLGLLPIQTEAFESLVYHGLAFVFIAVSLQSPRKSRGTTRSGGSVSIAIAIAFFLCLQGTVGMIVSLVLGAHPGFGLLLALGFEQGPGQALAMGGAWEKSSGFTDGAQVGLIMAAIGFGWSILAGVPLAAWGRRRGLQSDPNQFELPPSPSEQGGEAHTTPGALESLSRQLVAIGIAYLLTFGLIYPVGALFLDNGMDNLAHTVYGFHFIFGALFGMLIRVGIKRVGMESPLDDRLLGRLSGLGVDFVTCAAIAAVQIEVLTANWVPIVLATTLGGVVTLIVVVWLSARAFPSAAFEHCVMLFGMVTGTLPMGLALLRTLDPEMRTPASINAVAGSAMSIPLVAVFLMGLLPMAINGWPDKYPFEGFVAVGALVVYAVFLLGLWRFAGPLRFSRPLEIWPDSPVDLDASHRSA